MKRREVWWVNFDPSIGGEIKKKRPAVIISNHAPNKFLNRVQVVPLTRKTDRQDDHLLELAISSGTKLIVTHNTKDFKGVEEFGIRSITPKRILEEIL